MLIQHWLPSAVRNVYVRLRANKKRWAYEGFLSTTRECRVENRNKTVGFTPVSAADLYCTLLWTSSVLCSESNLCFYVCLCLSFFLISVPFWRSAAESWGRHGCNIYAEMSPRARKSPLGEEWRWLRKGGSEGRILLMDVMLVFSFFLLPLNCITCQSLEDWRLSHMQVNPSIPKWDPSSFPRSLFLESNPYQCCSGSVR